MPALVTFDTIPQLYTGILSMFEGQNKAALAYKDKKTKEWVDITYEQLREQVDAFTGFLYSHGVRKGDRVAILAENRPEWAIADLATQLLGGVNVGLYTTLPPSQIAYILKDSGAKVLVVSTAMQLRKAEEIMDQCPDLKMVVTMSELKKDREGRVMMWEDALAEGASVWAAQSAEIEPLFNASDNAPLAAKGIPAPTFSPGFRSLRDPLVARYYHRAADHADASYPFGYLLRFSQAYARAARLIADAPVRPRWTTGDAFESTARALYGSSY